MPLFNLSKLMQCCIGGSSGGTHHNTPTLGMMRTGFQDKLLKTLFSRKLCSLRSEITKVHFCELIIYAPTQCS